MSDNSLPSSSQRHSSNSSSNKPQLTPKISENIQKLSAKKSLKRAAQSEAAEQLDEERRRQNNAARPSGSAGNYVNDINSDIAHIVVPRSSKNERSTLIGERDQTAAAASSSDKHTPSQLTSGKRHRSSQVREAEKQQPILPIIDVVRPKEVISVVEAGHLQDERQASKENNNSQSRRASNTTTESMAPSQLRTSVEQPPSSDHYDHRRHSQDGESSNTNVQPRITDVRSITENEHEQTRTNRILTTEPYASHHLPSSSALKMSARLYSHMNERPSLIPMHEPVEIRIRLANSERLMAIAAQNPSNLMDPRRSSTSQRQEPTDTQSTLQNKPQFKIKIEKSSDINALDPKIIIERIDSVAPQSHQNNPGNFNQEQRQELRRTPTEGINPAQTTRSGIEINIPPCHLISTKVANGIVLSSDTSRKREPPLNHRDTQQQPRPSEPQVGISNNSRNDRRLPTIQGVTQRSTPHVEPSIPDSIRQSNTYTDNLLQLQRLEARLQRKQIDRDPGSKVPSQNIIPAATGKMRSLERPSFLSQQDKRERFWSDKDNMCQPPLPQQQLIHQLPEIATKRVNSESNIVNPSAVRSPPRSAYPVRQTGNRLKVDPVTPGQSSSPGSVAVGHGVIPKQDLFTNNVDCAGTSGGHGCPSANKQAHTRMVLEQQILDHFSTIFTQLGSNLYYSCDMYKNLRSSILETADTNKKIMEVAERFNALGAAESAASFSSTEASRNLPLNEERQSRSAKRANYSSHNQHSSRVDKEPPNKKRTKRWKIVVPAEYDPNNTVWTLKYRKMVPELMELVPGRGLYVNCTKLIDAEQVSGDCKTLATLVLEEVFSEAALVVCSTMHETQSPKDCWIERPPLDPAAWDTLFNYVIEFGSHHGWNIDTAEIKKAMDDKIYEIRVKHDLMAEPCSQ